MPGRLRPNVCVVVKKRGTDEILLCHRRGFLPGEGWQFPQGGIDESIDLVDELKRELREEIGTDAVAVKKFSSRYYSYIFPQKAQSTHPGFTGQRQRWALVELEDDVPIRFDFQPAEFDAYQWATPAHAVEQIVDFKKEIYREALSDLGLLKSEK